MSVLDHRFTETRDQQCSPSSCCSPLPLQPLTFTSHCSLLDFDQSVSTENGSEIQYGEHELHGDYEASPFAQL